MNEFEALKRIKQETCPATYMPDFNKEECCDVIEKALLELKAIKESKPSKALEELENVIEEITISNADLRNTLKVSVLIATIKQALLKAEKLEKVLEIIKEKYVAIFWVKESKSVDEYNYGTGETMKLTQQEFDLLKEVLK